MVVNDNAGSLASRGVLGIIASKLAPTGHREIPTRPTPIAYLPRLCHNRELFSLVNISQSVMRRVVSSKPSK
jgi:hypothetical protein